ncbi:MAG TPA: aminoglycoside phosphotransferase family protein [Acidimicrobiales bacterium]|nr:aminoglycoside phosphotransferase family protein [Acidimicrobiales bacterium]
MKPPAEAELDDALVRQLLQSQFPAWATLELTHVDGGWNNEMYRLGADLAVRVPRRLIGAQRVERQHRWLPLLAPRLPLPIPVPVGKGEPGFSYPWRWSVVPWFDGRPASVSSPPKRTVATGLLTTFLRALWGCDSSGGPVDDLRGTPLRLRDEQLRSTVGLLRPVLASTGQILGVWHDALRLPEWDGLPKWLHGDLHPGNILVRQGALVAVIDFEHMGAGDPACDLLVAWTLLGPPERQLLRDELEIDDATWLRGRGWAIEFGARALAYSAPSAPLWRVGHTALTETMADAGVELSWRE